MRLHHREPADDDAASPLADRQPHTCDAPRPAVASARGQRTLACGKGSVFSLEGLLQDLLVQGQFRDRLLQALVLSLKILQTSRLVDLQSAVQTPPSIVS